MRRMAMGKRKRDRQLTMWVPTTELPTSASHPFYARLNELLRDRGFDDFAEARCATFYAAAIGRPGLAPGIYFRLRVAYEWRSVCGLTRRPMPAAFAAHRTASQIHLDVSGRSARQPCSCPGKRYVCGRIHR